MKRKEKNQENINPNKKRPKTEENTYEFPKELSENEEEKDETVTWETYIKWQLDKYQNPLTDKIG